MGVPLGPFLTGAITIVLILACPLGTYLMMRRMQSALVTKDSPREAGPQGRTIEAEYRLGPPMPRATGPVDGDGAQSGADPQQPAGPAGRR